MPPVFLVAATGSAPDTARPWFGWQHFEWTIRQAQFVAGLAYLAAQYPTVAISTDPTHYTLTKMHLNAEIHFSASQTELGWSMRATAVQVTQ